MSLLDAGPWLALTPAAPTAVQLTDLNVQDRQLMHAVIGRFADQRPDLVDASLLAIAKGLGIGEFATSTGGPGTFWQASPLMCSTMVVQTGFTHIDDIAEGVVRVLDRVATPYPP